MYHWNDWLDYRASHSSGKFSKILMLACKSTFLKATAEAGFRWFDH
jgi:hypothetical protein